MLFTSKSNTNATTNTTATETTETTNNNGGLLKGLAIGIGTVAGIGLAAFGGKKAYNHFHVKDENNMENVTVNDDDSEEVTENNETVESFNEVDTEETENTAPVEDEASEAEEHENPEPAKAEEAKAEATKETPAEDEKPSAASLVDQLETEASVFEKEMVLPIEVKTGIEQMDFLMGRIAQCHRTIGDNARISVALRKMQNGVKDFWLGINTKLTRQASELESLDVIEDLFGADMDMVDRAYFDMQYINKSTLVLGTKDATVQLFNRLVRVADKMSKKTSTKTTGETQTVENCFDAFKDGHKETNKVDAETKTSTKPSVGETQTTENAFDVFKDGHKESNKVERETKSSIKKVTGETKTVTKSGKKQTKSKASKTVDAADQAINQFIETGCEEMVKSSLKSLASLDYVLDVKDQKPCEWLHKVAKHVDSNIDGLLKTNHATEAFKLTKTAKRDIEYAVSEVAEYMIIVISNAATIEDLDNIKASVAALSDSVKLNHIKVYQATINRINDVKTSLNNMYTQIKTAVETKTAEPVVDETQATKEVPSETQIGNSEVISDDGETVTLKASVSEESVQNVMDVINIVSVIPDRDHPEKNDMPYFIRVIGSRIHGIKEPEATFVAYDEASKSNKFMDACVDVCDMAGKAICNLANSGKNPLASMHWIDRCTNELVASGIIDNTYDPDTYRAAILKAHKEAIDALSKLVSGETKTDNKSSGETQTEETLTYTMSDKIKEAVQQSDETAATAEPEPESQAPMSPEASSLALKLQEVGALMRAEKWSDAAEFYKTQLTPYLADDGLSKELRNEIMGIKTKATNMLMSQKQLEAKQKAASAKASKKGGKRRRRH